MASIKVGDVFPSMDITIIPESTYEEGCSIGSEYVNANTAELFKGKKVVIVGVPGAFTPTCSEQHLPGYVSNYDAFKMKGISSIYCMSVNDKFVMKAWGIDQKVGNKVAMLPDGAGVISKAVGLDVDLTGFGMGIYIYIYIYYYYYHYY